MPDRSPQRKLLLREGLTSYLDAVMAIDEFTRMVQEDCHAVLERQVIPIQEVTVLRFSLKEISDYSEPYKSRTKLWAGSYAWIGTELLVKNSAKFYSMDAGLGWKYENGDSSARWYSSFYTNQLGVLNELDSVMRRHSNARFEVDKTHYGLILWGGSAIGPDGEYAIEPLERVVVEWIAIWRKAGSAAKIFSNSNKK